VHLGELFIVGAYLIVGGNNLKKNIKTIFVTGLILIAGLCIIADIVVAAPWTQTVNDGDAGYSETGNWKSWFFGPAVGGSYRYLSLEIAGIENRKGKASWSVQIPQTGMYKVEVSYRKTENRTYDADYYVHDGNQKAHHFSVSQWSNPTEEHLTWTTLGTFAWNKDQTSVVELDGTDDTQSDEADAVRWTLVEVDQDWTTTVDDSGSGYSETGNWKSWPFGPAVGGSYRYLSLEIAGIENRKGKASWSTQVPKNGLYKVEVSYRRTENRTNDADYFVHDGNRKAHHFSVNQWYNYAEEHLTWTNLGTFQWYKNQTAVVELDGTDDTHSDEADAVRWTLVKESQPPPPPPPRPNGKFLPFMQLLLGDE
jgi:predicted secreted protein